ncbi:MULTISPECIES: hypothetical protein [Arthrobacter]|uniref:Uncharacterized protein n=1 Tax=Arthrobacter terricola TaxID=2547396 RepID=A0A4R5K4P9_9MICC|nr:MULTISPECIES: hypothetical protein [Arthrobacter]MBT8159325.1 hypothetical protein [Arthrobacter sp. GN70]TDF86879.1 hypothetical protein E1809_25510 [Arthrobacter terricola]
MSEDTTNVGNITAKLKVDSSAWTAEMDKAEAKARELGTIDPSIKVDANVGEALAKLDAVSMAERNLDNAYQRSAISQAKLDAVTKKYGDDSLQAAQARLTHKKAMDAEYDAEAKLSDARLKAISEIEQAAQATEQEAQATNKAVSANKQRISGWQVLIALAPALLGPVAAISAAAVGLGVAFGGMAAGGVAAIVAIKKEMEDGTTVGNEYAAGLSALKGDLSELGSSSANAMLGQFNTAVAEINVKMPFLNQFLSDGAAALGVMGNTALKGVLDGLQQMNPLIQDGTVQLSKFVTWLFSFTGTNGFTEFIQYARDNLPGTMTLIENLVTLAGRILAAFAPLGPVVIGFLNAVTGLLNSFPLPVLESIVATAVLIGPAFKLASVAVGTFGETAALSALQVEILGVSVNLAIPVVGIFTALLAGISIAAATSAASTQQATAATQDYTQALKDDNEELGNHVRAQAAKALSDAGAYDAARKLGITQTVLTDALMGVAGAQDIVNDAVKKGKDYANDYHQHVVAGGSAARVASSDQIAMGKAVDTVTNALGGQSAAIQKSKQDNIDQAAAMDKTTGALTAEQIALQGQAAQYGVSVSMYQAATDAQQKAADQTAETTVKLQLQNNAADLLKQAWDSLNGKTLSAAQAQNSFDSSLANMGDHIDKTGKKIHFTTTNIGDMSAASVALRGQLNGQVQALEGVVEANGGLQNATGQSLEQYKTMRQQIIDNAVAHGVDRDAVTNYIDKLFQIPKSVPPTKLEIDKAKAEADIAEFQRQVDAVHGKTIDLITRESTQKTADTLGTRTNPTTGEQETYVSTPGTAETPGSGTGNAARGSFLGYAHGGSVAYLATGGHPGEPRGTDTVPAWLTPREFVVKRASAESIGLPALNYMNQTGQLPPQQGAPAPAFPSTVKLVVDGHEFTAYVAAVADTRVTNGINAANRDAARRPSR